MDEVKDVFKESKERFQKICKELALSGINEVLFSVTKEQFKSQYAFLFDYEVAATAKIVTYSTFNKDTSVSSFRYLGLTIHFLIVK
jgi:hypothetical protein